MIQQRKVQIGLALAILVGLVVVFGALTAYAQDSGGTSGTCDFTQMMGGQGMMGQGMMGGTMPNDQQKCLEAGMFSMGMMGGQMGMNGGMMMGGEMGMNPDSMGQFGPGTGMMGAWTPSADLAPAGKSLTLDGAVKIAKAYVTEWKSERPLEVDEVMQFDNHFYAEVRETETGRGAFEILIDPTTGIVYAEPGPNMMWNLRYGTMGSYMGISQAAVNGDELTVTPEQARQDAQSYLEKTLPGTQIADTVDTFYGYYTLHILRDNTIVGMLSVNGYNGQVWLHHWHGTFVDMTDLGEKAS